MNECLLTLVLQEIGRARQHQAVILNRPVLSTSLHIPAPTHPLDPTHIDRPALSTNVQSPVPTHPLNPAHLEVNSLPAQQAAAASAAVSTTASTAASALVGAKPALAGIKREASDTQFTDQQPVKVAKLHAGSQTAHPYGHTGTYHQPRFTMGPSPQGADPGIQPQTAHTLSHTEGQNRTASAQQTPSEQLPLSTEQPMLELGAAKLSSGAKTGPEAAFSMHPDVNTVPIKLEWSPPPPMSLSGYALPANAVTSAAAAAADCRVGPKSVGPQQTIGMPPTNEWDAFVLGNSPTSGSASQQPQAAVEGQSLLAAVKTEPQQLPVVDRQPNQMGTGDSSFWFQAAGSQMVKADPDPVLLGPRTEAQRAVPIKLESEGPVNQPWLQPGLHPAAPIPAYTTRAEGTAWQPQGSPGQLVAPELLHAGTALPHVKLQTSSSALKSSPPTALVPVVAAYTGQGSSSTLSAPSAAVHTTQPVAPPWTPNATPMARASAYLGPPAGEGPTAAGSTPTKREPTNNAIQLPQHAATDSIGPPYSPSSFSGTYVADLLAKRRRELLAEAGAVGSIPANNRHSSARGTKPTQDA